MWALRTPDNSLRYELREGVNTVGRSERDCTIVLRTSRSISSRHANLEVARDIFGELKVYFSDLKSTNGTFVNGTHVTGQRLKTVTLNDGDTLRFGYDERTFKLEYVPPPGQGQQEEDSGEVNEEFQVEEDVPSPLELPSPSLQEHRKPLLSESFNSDHEEDQEAEEPVKRKSKTQGQGRAMKQIEEKVSVLVNQLNHLTETLSPRVNKTPKREVDQMKLLEKKILELEQTLKREKRAERKKKLMVEEHSPMSMASATAAHANSPGNFTPGWAKDFGSFNKKDRDYFFKEEEQHLNKDTKNDGEEDQENGTQHVNKKAWTELKPDDVIETERTEKKTRNVNTIKPGLYLLSQVLKSNLETRIRKRFVSWKVKTGHKTSVANLTILEDRGKRKIKALRLRHCWYKWRQFLLKRVREHADLEIQLLHDKLSKAADFQQRRSQVLQQLVETRKADGDKSANSQMYLVLALTLGHIIRRNLLERGRVLYDRYRMYVVRTDSRTKAVSSFTKNRLQRLKARVFHAFARQCLLQQQNTAKKEPSSAGAQSMQHEQMNDLLEELRFSEQHGALKTLDTILTNANRRKLQRKWGQWRRFSFARSQQAAGLSIMSRMVRRNYLRFAWARLEKLHAQERRSLFKEILRNQQVLVMSVILAKHHGKIKTMALSRWKSLVSHTRSLDQDRAGALKFLNQVFIDQMRQAKLQAMGRLAKFSAMTKTRGLEIGRVLRSQILRSKYMAMNCLQSNNRRVGSFYHGFTKLSSMMMKFNIRRMGHAVAKWRKLAPLPQEIDKEQLYKLDLWFAKQNRAKILSERLSQWKSFSLSQKKRDQPPEPKGPSNKTASLLYKRAGQVRRCILFQRWAKYTMRRKADKEQMELKHAVEAEHEETATRFRAFRDWKDAAGKKADDNLDSPSRKPLFDYWQNAAHDSKIEDDYKCRLFHEKQSWRTKRRIFVAWTELSCRGQSLMNQAKDFADIKQKRKGFGAWREEVSPTPSEGQPGFGKTLPQQQQQDGAKTRKEMVNYFWKQRELLVLQPHFKAWSKVVQEEDTKQIDSMDQQVQADLHQSSIPAHDAVDQQVQTDSVEARPQIFPSETVDQQVQADLETKAAKVIETADMEVQVDVVVQSTDQEIQATFRDPSPPSEEQTPHGQRRPGRPPKKLDEPILRDPSPLAAKKKGTSPAIGKKSPKVSQHKKTITTKSVQVQTNEIPPKTPTKKKEMAGKRRPRPTSASPTPKQPFSGNMRTEEAYESCLETMLRQHLALKDGKKLRQLFSAWNLQVPRLHTQTKREEEEVENEPEEALPALSPKLEIEQEFFHHWHSMSPSCMRKLHSKTLKLLRVYFRSWKEVITDHRLKMNVVHRLCWKGTEQDLQEQVEEIVEGIVPESDNNSKLLLWWGMQKWKLVYRQMREEVPIGRDSEKYKIIVASTIKKMQNYRVRAGFRGLMDHMKSSRVFQSKRRRMCSCGLRWVRRSQLFGTGANVDHLKYGYMRGVFLLWKRTVDTFKVKTLVTRTLAYRTNKTRMWYGYVKWVEFTRQQGKFAFGVAERRKLLEQCLTHMQTFKVRNGFAHWANQTDKVRIARNQRRNLSFPVAKWIVRSRKQQKQLSSLKCSSAFRRCLFLLWRRVIQGESGRVWAVRTMCARANLTLLWYAFAKWFKHATPKTREDRPTALFRRIILRQRTVLLRRAFYRWAVLDRAQQVAVHERGKVLAYGMKRVTKSSHGTWFWRWKAFTEHARARRERRERLVYRARRRRLHEAFHGWAQSLRERQRRMVLLNRFMGKKNATTLRTFFHGWLEVRRRYKLLNRYVQKLAKRSFNKFFQVWREFVRRRIEVRKNILIRIYRRRQYETFQRWKLVLRMKEECRQLLRRIILRMQGFRLRLGFRRWTEWTIIEREVSKNLGSRFRTLRTRHDRLLLRDLFQDWKSQFIHKRNLRARLVRHIIKRDKVTLANCFAGWRLVIRRIFSMRRFLMKAKHRRLALLFHKWRLTAKVAQRKRDNIDRVLKNKWKHKCFVAWKSHKRRRGVNERLLSLMIQKFRTYQIRRAWRKWFEVFVQEREHVRARVNVSNKVQDLLSRSDQMQSKLQKLEALKQDSEDEQEDDFFDMFGGGGGGDESMAVVDDLEMETQSMSQNWGSDSKTRQQQKKSTSSRKKKNRPNDENTLMQMSASGTSFVSTIRDQEMLIKRLQTEMKQLLEREGEQRALLAKVMVPDAPTNSTTASQKKLEQSRRVVLEHLQEIDNAKGEIDLLRRLNEQQQVDSAKFLERMQEEKESIEKELLLTQRKAQKEREHYESLLRVSESRLDKMNRLLETKAYKGTEEEEAIALLRAQIYASRKAEAKAKKSLKELEHSCNEYIKDQKKQQKAIKNSERMMQTIHKLKAQIQDLKARGGIDVLLQKEKEMSILIRYVTSNGLSPQSSNGESPGLQLPAGSPLQVIRRFKT